MAAPVFLDYNATTPVSDPVLAAVTAALRSPGNASSAHLFGRTARAAVDRAREQLAHAVGARASELFFTSGATEGNNLAFACATSGHDGPRRRVLVSTIEHKAVLDVALGLRAEGWDVGLLPVGTDGQVDLEAAAAAFDDQVALVSVQLANNETGALQPVQEVAALAERHGALVHTDAAQALGKMDVDLDALGVHYASFSGHKVHGPQGTGALYVQRGAPRRPLFRGGGQERELRPGTENVPGIVGLGLAAELASTDLDSFRARARRQTDLLLSLLQRGAEGVRDLLPDGAPRLDNTLALRVTGVDNEALQATATRVAFSTGSACNVGAPEPSHVFTELVGASAAQECVRFSTGRPTTDADIRAAAEHVLAAVARLRMLDQPEADLCA